jgi:activating signal cointegrator 1
MKVISLYQPWASLIALGYKTLETRSWQTPYHGPIAIQASMRWTASEKVYWEWACQYLYQKGHHYHGLQSTPPRGVIVAIARLRWCHWMDETGLIPGFNIPDDDRLFGDLSPGRFAWLLTDVKPIFTILAWKGAQGLRDLPPEIAARAAAYAESDARRRREEMSHLG